MGTKVSKTVKPPLQLESTKDYSANNRNNVKSFGADVEIVDDVQNTNTNFYDDVNAAEETNEPNLAPQIWQSVTISCAKDKLNTEIPQNDTSEEDTQVTNVTKNFSVLDLNADEIGQSQMKICTIYCDKTIKAQEKHIDALCKELNLQKQQSEHLLTDQQKRIIDMKVQLVTERHKSEIDLNNLREQIAALKAENNQLRAHLKSLNKTKNDKETGIDDIHSNHLIVKLSQHINMQSATIQMLQDKLQILEVERKDFSCNTSNGNNDELSYDQIDNIPSTELLTKQHNCTGSASDRGSDQAIDETVTDHVNPILDNRTDEKITPIEDNDKNFNYNNENYIDTSMFESHNEEIVVKKDNFSSMQRLSDKDVCDESQALNDEDNMGNNLQIVEDTDTITCESNHPIDDINKEDSNVQICLSVLNLNNSECTAESHNYANSNDGVDNQSLNIRASSSESSLAQIEKDDLKSMADNLSEQSDTKMIDDDNCMQDSEIASKQIDLATNQQEDLDINERINLDKSHSPCLGS